MTFTLHTELSPSEDALEQLLDGCADVRVEFEADPLVERDPVEVDWPPVIERGISVDCDVGDVVIEEVWAEVGCGRCRGEGVHRVSEKGMFGRPELITYGCPTCKGTRTQSINIRPRLSPKDLAKLKEECAEHARDYRTDYGARD